MLNCGVCLVLFFGVIFLMFVCSLWQLQEKFILTNLKLRDQTFSFGLQEMTLRKNGKNLALLQAEVNIYEIITFKHENCCCISEWCYRWRKDAPEKSSLLQCVVPSNEQQQMLQEGWKSWFLTTGLSHSPEFCCSLWTLHVGDVVSWSENLLMKFLFHDILDFLEE